MPAAGVSGPRPAPPQAAPAPVAFQTNFQVNGFSNGPVQRDEQTFQEGDTTRHVTTETQTKKFGGTTITKVTREVETTNQPQWQPMPQAVPQSYQEPPPQGPATPKFNVAKVSAAPDTTWTPLSMTIGNKENIAPYKGPTFNVTKVNVDNPKGIWVPGGGPPPQVPRPRTPTPPRETVDAPAPTVWQPSLPPQQPAEPQQLSHDTVIDSLANQYAQQQPQQQPEEPHFVYPVDGTVDIDIAKLMYRPESDDSLPDSPGAHMRRSKLHNCGLYIVIHAG